jgi:hypothetical protein
VDSDLFCNGQSHGFGGPNGQTRRIGWGNLWPQEDRKPETQMRSGLPSITSLAASSGLGFGENDKALRTSLLRHLPHQIVGRRGLFHNDNFVPNV